MKKNTKNILTLIISIFIIFIVSISIIQKSNIFMIIGFIFLSILGVYSFYREEYFFLGFLFAFFLFLYSGDFVMEVFGGDQIFKFSTRVNNQAYIQLIISILGLGIGYYLTSYIQQRKYLKKNTQEIFKKDNINVIRIISGIIFIFALIISSLLLKEKIDLVRNEGFLSIYLGYKSKYPSLMIKLSALLLLSYVIFLASFPNKKQFYIITIPYFVYSGFTLMTYQRLFFMTNYILIFLYVLYRQSHINEKIDNSNITENQKKWFTPVVFVLFLVSLVVIFPTMEKLNTVRFSNTEKEIVNKRESKKSNIKKEKLQEISNLPSGRKTKNPMVEFARNQGFSINVIKWTIINKDKLPNKNYLFGDILDYVEYVSPFRKLINKSDNGWYKNGNSIEMATKSRKLSHLLSYSLFKKDYLSGRGIGGAYVAEAYKTYGYVGIFISSLLISSIIAFLYRRFNILRMIFGLLIYSDLLIMPRGSFSQFMLQFSSIKNIACISLIFLLAFFIPKYMPNTTKKINSIMDI